MSAPCFSGLCVRHDLQVRCDGLERDKTALLRQCDELLTALRAAESFIEHDTCRHDHEKAPVLAALRATHVTPKTRKPRKKSAKQVEREFYGDVLGED